MYMSTYSSSVLYLLRTLSQADLFSIFCFIKDRDLFLVIYNSTGSLHTTYSTTLEIKHMSFYVAFLFYCITVTQQDKLS